MEEQFSESRGKDMIKREWILILVPVLILAVTGLAVQRAVAKAQTVYNVDRKGIAIKGYDPVGYFTMSKPVQGNAEFVA